MNEVILKDALNNLNYEFTNSDYQKGILVGLIGGIMACRKIDYRHAVKILVQHMPKKVRRECFPINWADDFAAEGIEIYEG